MQTASKALEDISNPSSPNFGKHWKSNQVAKHFAPPSRVVKSILTWLEQSGISGIKVSNDASHVSFETDIQQAEYLLRAQYFFIEGSSDKISEVSLAVDEYSIPSRLDDYIAFIHPTFTLGLSSARSPLSWANSDIRSELLIKRYSNASRVNCLKYTTPACLRQLYNIPEGEAQVHPNNTFGIYQMSWKTWMPEDLDMFFSRLEPQLIGRRPDVQAIDGGYFQTNYTGPVFNAEPSLDFEYGIALTYPQPVLDIQVGDFHAPGFLNHMLAAYDTVYCGAIDPVYDPSFSNQTTVDCGNRTPPAVISISYAWNEENFPHGYLQRQCLEFGMLYHISRRAIYTRLGH
jgi:tripeptidyl-peptidase-1